MALLNITSCNNNDIELVNGCIARTNYLRVKYAILSCYSGTFSFYAYSSSSDNWNFIHSKSFSNGLTTGTGTSGSFSYPYCITKIRIVYSNATICGTCPEKIDDNPIALRFCLECDFANNNTFPYPITIIA